MKILCIGDNITKGTVGCSYVQLLQKRNPAWLFVNAGVSGDPLVGIGQRLIHLLKEGQTFDAVVFQSGYNDLLFTAFKKRGYFLRNASNYKSIRSMPIDNPQEYERKLTDTIERIRELSNAIIIITTIGCLGENLSSPLNKKRRDYNTSIRKVALLCNCGVADVSYRFYEELKQNECSDHFQSFTFLDKLFHILPGGIDFLSNRRGLSLSTDGMHLNSRGAAIFTEEIEKQIFQLSETKLLEQAFSMKR